MGNNKKNIEYDNKTKKNIKNILYKSGKYCIFQTIDNMGCRLMARRLTVNQVIGGSNPSVPAWADQIWSAFPLMGIFLKFGMKN